jgi:hypothetical protein
MMFWSCRLVWAMVSGSPERAVAMRLVSMPRSHLGPPVVYCSAAAKMCGRSKALGPRFSREGRTPANWPTSSPVGCEKLKMPLPSSMAFEKV